MKSPRRVYLSPDSSYFVEHVEYAIDERDTRPIYGHARATQLWHALPYAMSAGRSMNAARHFVGDIYLILLVMPERRARRRRR